MTFWFIHPQSSTGFSIFTFTFTFISPTQLPGHFISDHQGGVGPAHAIGARLASAIGWAMTRVMARAMAVSSLVANHEPVSLSP